MLLYGSVLVLASSCVWNSDQAKGIGKLLQRSDSTAVYRDSSEEDNTAQASANTLPDTLVKRPLKPLATSNVQPRELVSFAQTLIGTPYVYGSTDPKVGFDCSGFITYVFNHFGVSVPRSSIEFTHVGKPVSLEEAKVGDIVLFTGTDSADKFVGHMGIVTENQGGNVQFIHSTSGKAHGVTITPLETYYKKRYVKTIRVFPQND